MHPCMARRIPLNPSYEGENIIYRLLTSFQRLSQATRPFVSSNAFRSSSDEVVRGCATQGAADDLSAASDIQEVQGYLAQGLLTHRQRSLRYEFAECCSEGPLQAMTVISALAL